MGSNLSRFKHVARRALRPNGARNKAPVHAIQELQTEGSKPLPDPEPTDAALSLLRVAEGHLSAFKTGGSVDSFINLDLAIASYREARDLSLPGHATWVTASFGLAQALREEQGRRPGSLQTEPHLEETIDIYNQVAFLTPEDDPFHAKAVTLLSQALDAHPGVQVKSHVAAPLAPRPAAEGVVPSDLSDDVNPSDSKIDISKDEGRVARLYLADARSSLADFKAEGNTDSLNLSISWYQSALQLTPFEHADWATIALETAGALEDNQSINNEGEGNVSRLDEAIGIYKQVLCFVSNDAGCKRSAVSRLSQALRLRYKLWEGHAKNTPQAICNVATGERCQYDQGDGEADKGFSDDEVNELASLYLSSGRESFSTFKAESHSDILCQAISSYRIAIHLLTPAHPEWAAASLELVEALQTSHTGSFDASWGPHLDETIEICERVLASLPEHSGYSRKAVSSLSQILQLRYHLERNHGDPPEPVHAQNEKRNAWSNSTCADSSEGGGGPLSADERAELASFYLESARDSILTYRAEGYQESADLERAISSYRNAVSLLVPTDPSWVVASLELGDALEEVNHKYSMPLGCDVYRTEAIEVYKQVLRAVPPGNESRREVIFCFSWALITPTVELVDFEALVLPHLYSYGTTEFMAFCSTKDPRTLDRSIFWLRKLQRSLHKGPPSSVEPHSLAVVRALLSQCSISLTPDIRLLKEALWIYDLVLLAALGNSQKHEQWLPLLVSIAQAAADLQLQPDISIRFLRATIYAIERIAEVSPPIPCPERIAEIRRALASFLYKRSTSQPKHPTSHIINDLDDAIGHQTEALRCFKALSSPERAHAAGELAFLLSVRREATSGLDYSNQEAELYREAVFRCEKHRPVCRRHLEGFLGSLSDEAPRTGDPEWVGEALAYCQEIAEFLRSCPGGIDSDTPSLLKITEDIESVLEDRSISMGERPELHMKRTTEQLRYHQQTGNLTWSEFIGTLGGEMGAAAASLSPSIRDLFELTYNAVVLGERYPEARRSKLAGEAEAAWRQAETSAESKNDRLSSLTARVSPSIRAYLAAQRDDSPYHIDPALRTVRTALESVNLAPNNELLPRAFQGMLTSLALKRHNLGGNLQELKKSMALIPQRLLPARPEHIALHWMTRRAILLEHLGGRTSTRDFESALRDIGFEHLESMLEATQDSLIQFHHLALISPDTRSSLQTIQDQHIATSSLSSFVLLALLFAYRVKHKSIRLLYATSLATLEELRSVIWTQMTKRQNAADKVAEVAPDLANKLRELSHILSNPVQTRGRLHPDPSYPAETSSSVAATKTSTRLATSRSVQREWDNVVDEVRRIPGFERFLMRGPFEELGVVASEGPVVILTTLENFSTSFAFVIYEDAPEDKADGSKGKGAARRVVLDLVALEIGSEELESLRRQLSVTLGSRNRRASSSQSPQKVEGEAFSNANEGEGLPKDADPYRAGKRKRKDNGYSTEGVLSALWRKVAQPVIERLTAMEKPGIDRRGRIWWCPMGPFAFMPIHAAGTEDGMFCVSDFFISSYTPTLNALIQARNLPTPAPESTKVLAAIQPNPGKGWKELDGARVELEEIHKVVPSQCLISLSNPPGTPEMVLQTEKSVTHDIDLEGAHTTCANILSHLPTASILHLACHGSQDKSDPLLNGFVLRDGEELTVEMLMKSQEEAGSGGRCIAVLSACDTAAIDNEQPDEMINLANAMLFIGFKSVLATMWPMGDLDGPIIARAIYSELFSPEVNGDLSKFCLATVLDRVMREMRELDYSSCDSWATFIHIGA